MLCEVLPGSPLRHEPGVRPVRQVFAAAIANVHGNQADFLRAPQGLDIKPPRGRKNPHHRTRRRLPTIDVYLEAYTRMHREIGPVAEADQILIDTCQPNKPLVLRL